MNSICSGAWFRVMLESWSSAMTVFVKDPRAAFESTVTSIVQLEVSPLLKNVCQVIDWPLWFKLLQLLELNINLESRVSLKYKVFPGPL